MECRTGIKSSYADYSEHVMSLYEVDQSLRFGLISSTH